MDRIEAFWTIALKGGGKILPVLYRVADWADRLDWDTLAPLACVAGAIAAVTILLASSLGASDRRQVEFWSSFAIAGRWVALGAAVTPVVVWATTRR